MTPRVHLYLLLLPWALMFTIGLMFERPEFRPYELMIRGDMKFRANRTIEMDSHGALVYRYHAPDYAHGTHNVFSTDGAGLRNPLFQQPPKIVVAGDSFVVGVGVSDDQTIPARLGQHLGRPIYNYGTQSSVAASLFLADVRFARSPPPLLVYMPSATTLLPIEMPERVRPGERPKAPPAPPPPPAPSAVARAFGWWRQQGAPLYNWLSLAERDNGLKKRAQRDYHAAYRAIYGFPERIDVEGAPALVLTLEEQKLDQTPEERKVDEIVASWKTYAEANLARGTRILFVPLPESGDIYLDAFPDRDKAVTPKFLDAVLDKAREADLWTHDLRPTLTSSRSPYLFLRDDTHYAPHAIDIVAKEVSRVIVAGPSRKARSP